MWSGGCGQVLPSAAVAFGTELSGIGSKVEIWSIRGRGSVPFGGEARLSPSGANKSARDLGVCFSCNVQVFGSSFSLSSID
jgi:hypothetical protein